MQALARTTTSSALLAAVLLCAGLLLAPAALRAQSTGQAAPAVALSGIMGNKALLVIDGGPPKMLAPGDSHRGVKVVSAGGDSATLEIAGQRQTLRVGGAPVQVGQPAPAGSGVRIVLTADSGGHFVTQGMINSRPVQFLVDTGATAIGIGLSDAERLGLDYKKGEPVNVGTANGMARGWRIRLNSVRLNDVEVREVDAVVTPTSMPFVLLGNSYLARFQMSRNSEQMVLEKRN
jgi:aspartyl protease family protein